MNLETFVTIGYLLKKNNFTFFWLFFQPTLEPKLLELCKRITKLYNSSFYIQK